MKSIAWAVALAVLLPIAASAQSAPIFQGTIRDFNTGKALAGVHVRAVSKAGDVVTTSNSEGFYTLWNVPAGPFTVSYVRAGYLTMSGRLCSHPNLKRVVDVRLSRYPGSAAYMHWLHSRQNSVLLMTTNLTPLANCG